MTDQGVSEAAKVEISRADCRRMLGMNADEPLSSTQVPKYLST